MEVETKATTLKLTVRCQFCDTWNRIEAGKVTAGPKCGNENESSHGTPSETASALAPSKGCGQPFYCLSSVKVPTQLWLRR